MHARSAQASKLVSLKVDDVTAYGDKLFLPDTPLDMKVVHAYLQVHDTDTGDHEGEAAAAVTSEFVDKLVSIAAQSDMSASSPFEDLRELGCQTEVAFIENCIFGQPCRSTDAGLRSQCDTFWKTQATRAGRRHG
jgi:hypothetical protein